MIKKIGEIKRHYGTFHDGYQVELRIERAGKVYKFLADCYTARRTEDAEFSVYPLTEDGTRCNYTVHHAYVSRVSERVFKLMIFEFFEACEDDFDEVLARRG